MDRPEPIASSSPTAPGSGAPVPTNPGPDLEAAAGLVARMTLAEKASLLSGQDDWRTEPVPRLALGSVEVGDGPHGLRRETGTDMVWFPATCFPTLSALGSSWDRALVRRVGAALGTEARAQGVQVLLGPGINIKRSPLGGRNFEYLSEDPVHAGELGASYVQGAQSRGVGTSLKHFAVNNQETSRFWVSADVDERTLREIYLAGFERVVATAAPWTVMCAYNRVNGVHVSQHAWLLTQVLRDEWGFDGVVVSDWGAVHDRVASLTAGLDLEMPGLGGTTDALVVAAVEAGELPAELVDRSATRVAALVARGQAAVADPGTTDHDAHHVLAREAAVQSVVLLRNEGDALPIQAGTTRTLAVVGEHAVRPRIQGGGSAGVLPTRVDVPLDELRALAGDALDVRFALGYQDLDAVDPAGADGQVRHPGDARRDGDPRTDDELRAEAVALAAASDTTVVFVGLPLREEEEARDRTHLVLPRQQQALLEALATTGTRLVVVLLTGSPVVTSPWDDRADAVVLAGLLGQGSGWAVAQVLLGAAEPSGRLAESWPVRLEETPAFLNFPGERAHVRYGEGVFVGYRYYDAVGRPPRYPFGHGLGYTTFAYTDLRAERVDAAAGEVDVAVTVTNTGDRAGAEVVQVYVGDPQALVRRPVRELKAFEKVRLAPGASATVRARLSGRDFSFWDIGDGRWRREGGEFVIEVGASSADMRDRLSVTLDDGPGLPPVVDDDTLGGRPR